MNISELALINQPNQAPQKQQAGLRQAAEQFEAILLTQLTSALNGAGDDAEDNLFGGDGGMNLAKQMFSEQLADVMAQSGGVGVADMLMNQFAAKNAPEKSSKFNAALSAVREIKEKNSGAAKNEANAEPTVSNTGDGERLLRATRPRIVPDAALAPDARRADISPATNSAAVSSPNAVLRFEMPTKGRISSEFGMRFHPVDRKHKMHKGIDIAAPRGTPIAAAAEGTIVFAGWSRGYGKTVIVEHADGTRTRYAHADKLFVEEGERVAAGQRIAAVGSTGKSTGPHLHFEILKDGKQVNPLELLAKGFKLTRR